MSVRPGGAAITRALNGEIEIPNTYLPLDEHAINVQQQYDQLLLL